MRRVLVTNDDGIGSPGLCELASIARDLDLEVTVAAPRHQSSGASASILGTPEDGRIRFTPRELADAPGVRAFAVDAAPALITLIAAHGAFGPAPDLVLSGINRGANVGRAILHSGTVGAALTGGVNGGRGLAVSLDVGLREQSSPRWQAVGSFVRELVGSLLEAPAGTVLNLNVPDREAVAGLREATLAEFGIVQTTMTDSSGTDDGHVRLTVSELPAELAPTSDAALLAQGYATVTSIRSVSEAEAFAEVALRVP